MSRRTRIKQLRAKQRFSPSHHAEYSTSNSYFPRSYSIRGHDINFPISILPFYEEQKLNFAGEVRNFFKLEKEHEIDYSSIKTAFISIKGETTQKDSSFATSLIIYLSILCFCFYWLLKTKWFRQKYYTKYDFADYDSLSKIIQRVQNVDIFVLNFQDNQLTQEKIDALDEILSQTNIKNITLRNLSYYIEPDEDLHYFTEIVKKKGVNFKFIWENLLIESEPKAKRDDEERLNLMSDQP